VRVRTEDALLLAMLIVFPVIGLEQILHTPQASLQALAFYEALHWVSDSLLALPLAVSAVLVGHWLADRLGLRLFTASDVLARACVIALVLAVLLVPGAALHDLADGLTHSHALLGVHSHVATNPNATSGSVLAVVGDTLHALSDGLQGQAVGLPLAFFGLLWTSRGQRRVSRTRLHQKEVPA
jgi:hypothetical protein